MSPLDDSVQVVLLVFSRRRKKFRPSDPAWFLNELVVDGVGELDVELSPWEPESAEDAVFRRPVGTGVASVSSSLPSSPPSLEDVDDWLGALAGGPDIPGDPRGAAIGEAS